MMEIVVDAHDGEEQSMGWYYYLEEQLCFPFRAACVTKRATSPLHVKEQVEVIGVAGEGECRHEMFVTIRSDFGELAVPLAQLQPNAGVDERTRQAVADWHYWIQMGYEF